MVKKRGAKRWAYEGFDRDSWQHPEEVIKALEIQAGDQVADLGAGSGYFTFRLADAVGSTGKVYAVDIDAEMNSDLAKQVQDKGYQNIEIVLRQTKKASVESRPPDKPMTRCSLSIDSSRRPRPLA